MVEKASFEVLLHTQTPGRMQNNQHYNRTSRAKVLSTEHKAIAVTTEECSEEVK
jgi:hypothetical protein